MSSPPSPLAGDQKVSGGPAVYPMTVEQESMWLDDHLGDGPSRYLESWVCGLKGAIDRDAVQWALGRIVERHEVLRTQFVREEDRLLQVVRQRGSAHEPEYKTCPVASLNAELTSLVRRPMNVAQEAMRATLLDVAPDHAVLVLQLHHLVIDDWALQTLEREFEEHYRAYVEKRPARIPRPPLQPGPYAVAQRAARGDRSVLAYWRDNLRDLPIDSGRTLAPRETRERRTCCGDRITFAVDAAAAKRIRAVCRQVRATPFAVLTATVGLLLHIGTGSDDVIVGTPVSHRSSADLAQVLAPLSELLPLRLKADPSSSFADLVSHVRTKTHEAISCQEVSYSELLRLTRRRGEPGTRELCRTVVVVDDAQPMPIDLPGVMAERMYVHSGMSKFDLCFTFVAREQGYLGFLEYQTDHFSLAGAERVLADFATLLELATSDTARSLSQLGNQLEKECR
jgi:Condensation domain